jgi:hypothetical protein
MSACLLLDPIEWYLEMSVSFGLSIVQTLKRTAVFRMEMCYWNIFFWWWRGGDSDNKVVLQVIVKKRKI